MLTAIQNGLKRLLPIIFLSAISTAAVSVNKEAIRGPYIQGLTQNSAYVLFHTRRFLTGTLEFRGTIRPAFFIVLHVRKGYFNSNEGQGRPKPAESQRQNKRVEQETKCATGFNKGDK
jgi:hypothetical protein